MGEVTKPIMLDDTGKEILDALLAINETMKSNSGGVGGNAVLYTPQNPTEEQKAQARANIGAVELLESITLAESGTIIRDKTPDGRAYKLNRVKVYVRIPAENNTGGYVNLPMFSNAGKNVIFFCQFGSGERREMTFEAWKEANAWDAVGAVSATKDFSYLGTVAEQNNTLHEPGAWGDYIYHLQINVPIPAGSVVHIYGRWEKDA